MMCGRNEEPLWPKVEVTKTFELFLIKNSYNRRHAYDLKKVP
jgi:hypothetical protein